MARSRTQGGTTEDQPPEDTDRARFSAADGLPSSRGIGRALDPTAWLAAIVENSDDAILSKTLDGIITSWNQGAERLFGFTAEEAVGQSIFILIPEDRWHEEEVILTKIRGGERVSHFETVRRRKNGSFVDISLMVSPVRNEQGTIIGASKIARDITERKRHQEQQNLLLREMNHRIKNLFTVASALISVSERSAQDAADLAQKLRGRMAALARAHELTLPDLTDEVASGRTTTLFALFDAILTPHTDGEARTSVKGSDISIGGGALTSLALVLNEFATNSAKYGCLSVPQGRLMIESAIDGRDILITWTETDGPEVSTPEAGGGFGSLLEHATIEGSLHGSISREWAPAGLIISMRVPLSELSPKPR
jgi:PAS domain S-box-containing protein